MTADTQVRRRGRRTLIALALIQGSLVTAGCIPQLQHDSFEHDSGLYAYFDRPIDDRSTRAGTLVADLDILWDIPADKRGCVRRALVLAGANPPPDLRLKVLHDNCDGALPDRNMVLAGISGGGNKSEVFALFAMRELQAYGLLDQVDAFSSASGGSFAALIYSLSCDASSTDPLDGCAANGDWKRPIWDDTANQTDQTAKDPRNVRSLQAQGFLTTEVLRNIRPDMMWRNIMTYHDTGDTMTSVLRERFIVDKPDGSALTFNDLNPARPALILNATNLSSDRLDVILPEGTDHLNDLDASSLRVQFNNAALSFPFTRQYFWQIQANLPDFPLARALVASAAFPAIIDPATLRNYQVDPAAQKKEYGEADCAGTTYALWHAIPLPQRNCTNDHERFVHLTDGGVHDNVGASQLQWIIECRFSQRLSSRPTIGPELPWCRHRALEKPPENIVAIMIDSSVTAAGGKNPLIGEQRNASSGFPLRINTLLSSIDFVSMSNATQHKAELGSLMAELHSMRAVKNAVLLPIDILSLHDKSSCRHDKEALLSSNDCPNWKRAAEYAARHNRVLTGDIETIFQKASAVDVSFVTSGEDNLVLEQAAMWAVARQVSELCAPLSGETQSRAEMIFPNKARQICG